MGVVRAEDGSVDVFDGRTLVATARVIEPWVPSQPDPPSPQVARAARQHYLGHTTHEFRTCFTCGPDRDDGLAIFSGPVGNGVVASTWVADESLPATGGYLDSEIVWAALDCPGAWSSARMAEGPIVLGRMSAQILEPLQVGTEYVSYGWSESEEGRKTFAGTAVADDSGHVKAVSRQTWISPAG